MSQPGPIGIICALPEERAALSALMSDCERHFFCGREAQLGRLDGHDIALAESGVGKVASSVIAALLQREFNCRNLVVSGVAGGLDPDLDIGDIVIARSLVQHDYGQLSNGRLRSFRPGVPPLGEGRHDFHFDLPPEIEDRLKQVVASVALPDLPADLRPRVPTVSPRKRRIILGRIVSGDQFINTEDARIRLHREFAAHAVEMEGAAVAQVGAMLGVPVIVVRSVSDLAGADSHLDFPRFVRSVAPAAALVLRQIVGVL